MEKRRDSCSLSLTDVRPNRPACFFSPGPFTTTTIRSGCGVLPGRFEPQIDLNWQRLHSAFALPRPPSVTVAQKINAQLLISPRSRTMAGRAREEKKKKRRRNYFCLFLQKPLLAKRQRMSHTVRLAGWRPPLSLQPGIRRRKGRRSRKKKKRSSAIPAFFLNEPRVQTTNQPTRE